MAKVIFYGEMATKFGKEFNLAVATAGEAVHALIHQLPGLRNYLQQGGFYVRIGKNKLNENTVKSEFKQPLNAHSSIHIAPAIFGAGKFGQIIIGAVLIVASIYCPALAPYAGSIMAAGVGMVASGIAQVLMKPPSMDMNMGKEAEKSKSSAFSNLGNRAAEGGCVPIIYGRVRVGSKVISQSLESYKLQADGDAPVHHKKSIWESIGRKHG